MGTNHFWRHPSMPYVEGRCAQDSHACYAPHTHPTLSIGVVDSGSSVLACDGAEVCLRAGDLVVIPPDVVHSCNPRAGARWSYQMLYLDRQWLAEALGGESDQPWAVLRSADAYRRFRALNALMSMGRFSPAQEHLLAGFVRSLLKPDAIRKRESVGAEKARIADLQSILKQQCAEPWRLEQLAVLAVLAGMSPFQLIRKFRAHTGMTPHAYLLDARINQAKTLLREGRSLADVAYRLQFADQSHFQRAFKRRVAATPKAYSRGA